MAIRGLTRWDPFGITRRWDPFRELREMQRDMDRLFETLTGREPSVSESFGDWVPMVESYKKGNDLVLKFELPGVDPGDVDVSFDEHAHQLAVKGERKQEKDTREEDYVYREVSYGTFERRYTLPEGVKTDQLKAKYANGILEITVPAAALPKARKIEIETPKMIEGEKDVKKAA